MKLSSDEFDEMTKLEELNSKGRCTQQELERLQDLLDKYYDYLDNKRN